ncbi:MAG: 1-acyl-sn-glycerol-3-phosphate acyltransferase [Pseudomonadales bacterium]
MTDRRTIFRTPVLATFFYWVARFFMRLRGWKVDGVVPAGKFVIIAAPHTSNWDLPLTLGVIFTLKVDIRWIGKDALFIGWKGPIMRWLGGIAVDRSASNDMVSQMISKVNQADEILLCITPEGTRSKVREWKSGFYHIARGASVPILPFCVHAQTKTVGIAEPFVAGQDQEADFAALKSLYEGHDGIRKELG